MIARIVGASVDRRRLVLALTGAFAVLAAVGALRLELDALPDLTTNQVLVLTRAPGLTPEEVERFVTRPLETALGGVPGLVEQRNVSRYGLSAITVVFEDDVAPFLARQIVQERVTPVVSSLPEGVEPPELGPLSGGLGEIFHVTLSSPKRTPAELLELATWRAAPLLRQVPGIVEVNSWGGEERTLEVKADPLRLASRGLVLEDLRRALGESVGSVGGAALAAGGGQSLLRGVSRPADPGALAQQVVRPPQPDGSGLVRVGDVARVTQGARPRLGASTANGAGETVYMMAQMLRGANALDVTEHVRAQMDAVRAALPEDVRLDVVYDRSVLVKATLHTVLHSLLEGAALVSIVLFLMLGSLRSALVVAAAIPLSMLGAALAMTAFGIPGNLMSLGAIDFGLLVDGAVVMIEALIHELPEDPDDRLVKVRSTAVRMARPVFFSVLVILLVYVPVLALSGTDGKLFRPMALTVVFALTTALVLSLTFIPAAGAVFIRPRDVPHAPPFLARILGNSHGFVLDRVRRAPVPVALSALLVLALGGYLAWRSGAEFTPQLDEGDMVIQTTRVPDISLPSAIAEAGRFEKTVKEAAPEVLQVVSRIGSPAVATDVMGIGEADVFVGLRPRAEWRPGLTREQLVAEIDDAIRARAPGSEPGFTQPIQMRFNELIGGAVTDVAASIYGEDLGELRRLGLALAKAAEGVPGAADVRLLAPPDVSLVDVRPDPVEAGRAGLSAREMLDVVRALQAGVDVGLTFDGPIRVPVVLRLGEDADAFTVENTPVPVRAGSVLPLGRLAEVAKVQAPASVARRNAARRLVVGFNVRGADLGTVVQEVQRRAGKIELPHGYRVEWGGQYETMRAARARLNVVVPIVLLLIAGVLFAAFGTLGPTFVILTHVPFAAVGGIVALALREMAISLPAVIGFIALSGVAVLNGVVLMTRILELEREGLAASEAAVRAAKERARPVLTTALVAALGFVPMMLATGIGSEVQRPLATVVVGGLVTSTLLTLFVLPTVYGLFARRRAA